MDYGTELSWVETSCI